MIFFLLRVVVHSLFTKKLTCRNKKSIGSTLVGCRSVQNFPFKFVAAIGPKIAIGEDQLCFLIEQGFRIQDIAGMFRLAELLNER